MDIYWLTLRLSLMTKPSILLPFKMWKAKWCWKPTIFCWVPIVTTAQMYLSRSMVYIVHKYMAGNGLLFMKGWIPLQLFRLTLLLLHFTTFIIFFFTKNRLVGQINYRKAKGDHVIQVNYPWEPELISLVFLDIQTLYFVSAITGKSSTMHDSLQVLSYLDHVYMEWETPV